MTKFTKRANYEDLLTLIVDAFNANLITEEEDARLAEFLTHEIEQLDKRAASAKKYAKKNSKATDELADAIMGALTAENQTIPEIVDAVKAADAESTITPQKATYRLTKLVEDGAVIRETVSIKNEGEKGSRRVNVYKLAENDAE